MDNSHSIKRSVDEPELDPGEDAHAAEDNLGESPAGPEVIQFRTSEQEDQDSLPIAISQFEEGDLDELIEDAVQELRKTAPRLEHSARDREESLRTFLARAYKLSMTGMRSASAHNALLERTKVKTRSDTPHHKKTLRAIHALAGGVYIKGNEHEWSLVLAGMEEAKVPETEVAVVQFLTEEATVGGQVVKGFDRAKAVLRSSDAVKSRREALLQAKKAERSNTFDFVIHGARKEPLGSIEPTEDRSVSEKIWISLNEGDKILLDLRLTDVELQRLILKSKTKNGEAEQPAS